VSFSRLNGHLSHSLDVSIKVDQVCEESASHSLAVFNVGSYPLNTLLPLSKFSKLPSKNMRRLLLSVHRMIECLRPLIGIQGGRQYRDR